MRVYAAILAALAVLTVGGALWVRLAPSDPARWHVHPADVTIPGSANHHLMRGAEASVHAMSPEALAEALDRIARATPRTRRLAGHPDAGRMTYVTRSRLMGFPDYTSVAVEPAEGGARLLVFARARFGRSDLGVNRARVEDWLGQLAPR